VGDGERPPGRGLSVHVADGTRGDRVTGQDLVAALGAAGARRTTGATVPVGGGARQEWRRPGGRAP
jgi:hypothetical protein